MAESARKPQPLGGEAQEDLLRAEGPRPQDYEVSAYGEDGAARLRVQALAVDHPAVSPPFEVADPDPGEDLGRRAGQRPADNS